MKLPLYIAVNHKDVVLKVEENFNRLQRALNREFKILASWKLEYLDDYGENQPINDDESYFECLKCCDGQAHYMNVIEIVKIFLKKKEYQLGQSSVLIANLIWRKGQLGAMCVFIYSLIIRIVYR